MRPIPFVRFLFVSLVVGGCAASHADVDGDDTPSGDAVATNEAIVHGAADAGRHPAVVALVARDAHGTALCSGALVAPDVVLTARHCVSALVSEAVDCPASTAQVKANRDPRSIGVIIADDATGAAVVAHGAQIVTPPGHVLCDADVALIRLDHPIAGVVPMKIEDPRAPVPKTISSVGYGKTGPAGTYGARRFRSAVRVLSATPTELVVGESTCQGDSGGPAIDEETGAVVGVVSRGSGDCAGREARNVYTRLSAFAGLLEAVLGHHVPVDEPTPHAPSSDLGAPCTSGSTCSAGVCVEPDHYCSRPCGGDHGRCPAGYRCAKTADATVGACAKKE